MPKIPKRVLQPWRKEEVKRKPTQSNGFYQSKLWRATRKRYIEINPLCRFCEEKGIIKEAEVVDHIQPIEQGGAKLDISNLQPLCHSCHNRKSNAERFGNTYKR
jgi:5-methylcytosine-specific restriction enzyme A